MNLLLPVVMGIVAPGVWGCEALPDNAADLVRNRGWYPIEIDAADLGTKPRLLAAIAAAARFPVYFGHNWDAAAECLSDLSWLESSGYVVLVRNGSSLASSSRGVTDTLLDVLAEMAEEWAARDIIFTTVWEGALPQDLPRLEQL